jgi:hypothetical protein
MFPEQLKSRRDETRRTTMSAEDLEQYESELELQLYREYKDVVGIFTYAVETERRFYLCAPRAVTSTTRSPWAMPGSGTCTVRPVS